MNLNETLCNSLLLANTGSLSDTVFKNLIENCFQVLRGGTETYNLNNLYNSKADLVKEFYAALLSCTVEFIRNNQTKENVTQILQSKCNFNMNRINIYLDFYERFKPDVEMSLINIGSNNLPHVTDVNWKIDYIIKSSCQDQSDGPLFRIALQTERYDLDEDKKKIDFINFTCNSQELQDLVYKLKDALRHCQRIGMER